MSEHTELPALVVGCKYQRRGRKHFAIFTERGDLFSNVPFGDKNLATQVVRACNEYPDLIKQRDDLLAACERHKDITVKNCGRNYWANHFADMEAAIKKAGE